MTNKLKQKTNNLITQIKTLAITLTLWGWFPPSLTNWIIKTGKKMLNLTSQFRDAIYSSGLIPPNIIEPGKFYRFAGIGKNNNNRAGWCILSINSFSGYFGDWSSGLSEKWQAKQTSSYSYTDKKTHTSQKKKLQILKLERKNKYATAAKKAKTIWKVASPADTNHTYLKCKHIKPNGIKQYRGSLLIPGVFNKNICTLQFITNDGSKQFLKGGRVSGCYFSMGIIEGAETLCIAEGFATGATIHQETGHPVAIYFNAGNLKSVAQILHQKYPDIKITIYADNDSHLEVNIGLVKAREAAACVSGKLLYPIFDDVACNGTDFNDYVLAGGAL